MTFSDLVHWFSLSSLCVHGWLAFILPYFLMPTVTNYLSAIICSKATNQNCIQQSKEKKSKRARRFTESYKLLMVKGSFKTTSKTSEFHKLILALRCSLLQIPMERSVAQHSTQAGHKLLAQPRASLAPFIPGTGSAHFAWRMKIYTSSQ